VPKPDGLGSTAWSAIVARTVLVMDDNPEAAAALARVASASGVAPTVLTDSRSFASTFRRLGPGAVILDVMMPDQDGIEVLREIAAIAPATPVLVVTGHGEVWARMARDLGGLLGLKRVEMATKPVGRAAVVGFLEEAFGSAACCPGQRGGA
jgi:FixJ family two-component response regulator